MGSLPRRTSIAPGDDNADVSGDASGEIDDLVSHAIAAGLQIVGPELKDLPWNPCERFLPARLLLIDGAAAVGAQRVGEAVHLDLAEAISYRALDDCGGEFDLLVFRKAGGLA